MRGAGVVLLLIAACGKESEASAPATPREYARAARRPLESKTARIRAGTCRNSDDCIIVELSPCCVGRDEFFPASYPDGHLWVPDHEQRCAAVNCSASPRVEASCCASMAHCVDNRCVTSCEDPNNDAPIAGWRSAECALARALLTGVGSR